MKTRSKIANQDGVAAVEFAIILPFLVILIFGVAGLRTDERASW